jgi:hypothetical protein
MSFLTPRDLLILEGAPSTLDEEVVQGPPAPIHPEMNPVGFEPLCKGGAGELRPLIGVDNLRRGVHERSFQGADAEVTVEGDRDFPGHHVGPVRTKLSPAAMEF